MVKMKVLPEPIVKMNVKTEIINPVIVSKEITTNGTYDAIDDGAAAYNPVIVNVDITTPYNKGFEDGQKTEYDRFWDSFQNNGKGRSYIGAFSWWNDEIYNPKYPIICDSITNGFCSHYMFYQSLITDTKVDITLPPNQEFHQGFYGCWFLETIRKLIVDESVRYSNSFTYCPELKNLTIEGVIGQNNFNVSWSTKLTRESIISIINALSTKTTGKTVTLSKIAVINAFGSLNNKEWLNLIESKSNWNIALA